MDTLDKLDLLTAKIDGGLATIKNLLYEPGYFFLLTGSQINKRCQQLFYLKCYISDLKEEILPETAYKAQGVLIDAHRIINQAKIQEVRNLIELYNNNKYWFLSSKK